MTDTRLSGKAILWVENHPEDLKGERESLSAAGATLTYAWTPTEAFASMRARPYDIIILDILIPGELPPALKKLKGELSIDEDSEQNGVVLAFWLRREKRKSRCFFYTIVPKSLADRQDLLDDLNTMDVKIVNKTDRFCSGSNFAKTVTSILFDEGPPSDAD